MKMDGEEKRIRRLFSEISDADRRLAPEFASVLESAGHTARSHGEYRFRPALALSVACAALALLLTLAIVVTRHAKPQTPAVSDEQVVTSHAPPEPTPVTGVHVKAPVKRAARHVRPRKSPNDFAISVKELLAWQSPTASLLKAPNEELLNSLPRLGESLQTMQSLSPDRLN
jgi:hypothetical protein